MAKNKRVPSERRSALNSTNPALLQLEGQWHKLLALVMFAQDKREISITREQVHKFADAVVREGLCVVVDSTEESKTGILKVCLTTEERAEKLLEAENRRVQGN